MITPPYLPTKIIFGPGSINQLGEEAWRIGQRAMIITFSDIRRVGVLERVVNDLKTKNVDSVIFEELEPNVRTSTIDKGARIARDEKIDLIIGLGGGSAMDAAKGIALASSGKVPIWDYMKGRARVVGTVPPLIQVLTLAGTGSELNQIAVVTDWETHEKRTIIEPKLWAKTAIVDPQITVTVPKRLSASGGVDAFSHILECYLIPESPLPMNDAIREAVMKVTVQFLPRVLANPDNIEARSQLSWASTIASSQLSILGGSAGSMTCHGIEHAVSGYYDINHGAGLAALLPAWMRQIYPVRKERLELLGLKVFGKPDGIGAFEEWLDEVGMKLRLRGPGRELEHANKIAYIALKIWDFRSHPRTMDAGAIAQIYRDAY